MCIKIKQKDNANKNTAADRYTREKGAIDRPKNCVSEKGQGEKSLGAVYVIGRCGEFGGKNVAGNMLPAMGT